MDKIVVIGGGGHAKVLISIVKRLENFEIIGYTDMQDNGRILGIPYLGNDDELTKLVEKGIKKAVFGIGQIKNYEIRRKIVLKVKSLGFNFPPICAPSAIINEGVLLGEGVVVMDGAVINSGTKIGDFSIVNTNASVDHDCEIEEFVHIAPGVTLSGDVHVHRFTLVGTGAAVIQGITIGEGCVIGAGSAVMRNCASNGLYIGSPAKRFSKVR